MSMCYPANTDWSTYGAESEIAALDGYMKERAEEFAWYSLAAVTGWQVGVCPTVIRPCSARCAPAGSWLAIPVGGGGGSSALPLSSIGVFTPFVTGGQWVNSCGCQTGDCSCSFVSEVILPGPVGSIEEIKIDGVVVAADKYRVDNGNRLVALDPALAWPLCQDVTATADEDGSFVVTYYRGAAPNSMLRYAAGVLAVEFYKAAAGIKCRLPTGTTNVVRNGLTIEVNPDIFEAIKKIREVAAVIAIYNPNGLKVGPRVTSPDVGRLRGRQATWGAF